MEEVINEYKFGSDIVTYYETYIHVSLGYLPSELGGSVLAGYTYSYDECIGLSPKEIVDMAWEDYQKEWKYLEDEEWEEFLGYDYED